MIERVIDYSAKNKFVVFMLVALAVVAGWWAMRHMPLDVLPDLSETQVIVYSRWDRSPDIVEDQLTYPIVAALVGAPRVKAVRGVTDFGYSFIYVIFEDGTDIYWARTRTQELLASVLPRLPSGAKTELGPDATALGWIYQYAFHDASGQQGLSELRSLQDWYLRYHLKAVPGVAEVASLGGHVRQYQVNVDPNRLRAFGLPISRVVEAVRGGNSEVGGRLIEFGGTEYMVRGRGYARSVADFENIVLTGGERGAPIRVKDVGEVVLGPELRRGLADLDGLGEVVSGIVVMRQGENALDVIERVKAKIRDIEPGLPAGVSLTPVYDRSAIIMRSIDQLRSTLAEIMLTLTLIILLFLWHPASAIIPLLTIPIAVLVSFGALQLLGISANVMSLGGIAIAAGALVDAAIVVVEQTHKRLELWQRGGRVGDYRELILSAVKEVGRPSFFALLVIAVAFLPVLTLEGQEGRLFRPLAYTMTLSMLVAAVLAITLDPALRLFLTRLSAFDFRPRWASRLVSAVIVGSIHAEEKHPVSGLLMRLYAPAAAWSLRHKRVVFAAALSLVLATVPVYFKLGWEFMPPLDEGTLLYMPTTMPGISATEAQKLLRTTDRIIAGFPEVDRVLGKAGRADTSTDPAPLSMLETVVTLKPRSQWRKLDTWYSSWAPQWAQSVLRRWWPDHVSQAELVRQLDEALKIPGLANSWTMPIRGRIDMLSTGIRTPLGLKISGADLAVIDQIGVQVAALLPMVEGTRSVFAERAGAGRFLDIDWKREELVRHGLSIEQAQTAVNNAIGGENVTTTIEGRERYPVNVRYKPDFRSDLQALGRVLVSSADGLRQIPLSQLAQIRIASGPSMIRNEDGLLTGYVLIDLADRDPGRYVDKARELLRKNLALPAGYAIAWSGEHESIERVQQRLLLVVPLTLVLIVLLLYFNTRSAAKTFIVMLAVPFSAVGAVWLVHLLGYNLSIGVWVGLIALLGVDAATGVFMLLYLDLAYQQARREKRLGSMVELRQAILQGAVKRLRPKFMTVATMFLGLIPIMWTDGPGADVMKRIAAPMIGGIATSFLLELLVYPALYEVWRWHGELKHLHA